VFVGDESFSLSLPEDDFNKEKQTLFATYLWNGSLELSRWLVEVCGRDPTFITGKCVLEFGAGAGLPSLMARRLGARLVCASDYPSPSVLKALEGNAITNSAGDFGVSFHVIGHKWGEPVENLLQILHDKNQSKYDVILASECLWKHGESHSLLLRSIKDTVCTGGKIIMSFSHHIPGLESCDLGFFDLCESSGFFKITHRHTVATKHMWSDRKVDMYIFSMERL
jgi:nicotinamide N-methyltransferase